MDSNGLNLDPHDNADDLALSPNCETGILAVIPPSILRNGDRGGGNDQQRRSRTSNKDAIDVDKTAARGDHVPNAAGKGGKKKAVSFVTGAKNGPPRKSTNPAESQKLVMVKKLVEAQPSAELRNLLFSFSEEILSSLQNIDRRELGVAKLRGDDDYIPPSLRFQPEFHYMQELAQDEATMADDVMFKDIVTEFKRKLAAVVKRQSERNQDCRRTILQQKVITKMLKLGGYFADHQKIECELTDATANRDALAKSALVNFFKAIKWLDQF